MNDWKLKLKYGKTSTPYQHFTVLADGQIGELVEGFECSSDRAWMSMKTWSTDADESADMIQVIGEQIGFKVDGKIHIYETEPDESPREKPFGYAINFEGYEK
jgi:hypothetical protein